MKLSYRNTVAIVIAAGAAISTASAQTTQPSQMGGENGAVVTPLVTSGEFLTDGTGSPYLFIGIPDGMGAYALDANTVRVFVNHELGLFNDLDCDSSVAGALGGEYTQNGGALVVEGGARVSYLDIDRATRQVVSGGLAHTTIYGLDGNLMSGTFAGFNRFCSANLIGPAEGLVDTIFFTGEETSGGVEYALDASTGDLWALGDWGKAAWESVAILPTVGTDHENKTVFIIGDDRGGAPLLVYIGEKQGGEGASFLERNGLIGGDLYAFVSDDAVNPIQFNGTGNTLSGRLVKIFVTGPEATQFGGGLDAFGFADQAAMDAQYAAIGAFRFSRPEDVAYDPIGFNNGRGVMASTGRLINGVSEDNWGTLYQIDVNFSTLQNDEPSVDLKILLDSNDPGQQDFGVRSPDNLDWADDGMIYLQEDRSTGDFGQTSGRDALIWRFNPNTGFKQIVGEMNQMDPGAVPAGFTYCPGPALGTWESSGIIDVSSLFGEEAGTLHLFNIQTHDVEWTLDGTPETNRLALDIVEAGQVSFLDTTNVPVMPVCDGDSNGDGAVDLADLNLVLANFGTTTASGDTNGDGLVDLADLNRVLANFGSNCG